MGWAVVEIGFSTNDDKLDFVEDFSLFHSVLAQSRSFHS